MRVASQWHFHLCCLRDAGALARACVSVWVGCTTHHVTFPCMPPSSAPVAKIWAQPARHTRPARRERESCSTSQKLRHNHAHDSLCVPCHARRGTNLTARPVLHQCRYHALQKTPPDPSCSRYFTDVLGGMALPPDPDTTLQVGTCVKHRVRIHHSLTCAWPRMAHGQMNVTAGRLPTVPMAIEGAMLNTLSVLCDRMCSVMGVDTDGDGCL